jgi:hypothetical protein
MLQELSLKLDTHLAGQDILRFYEAQKFLTVFTAVHCSLESFKSSSYTKILFLKYRRLYYPPTYTWSPEFIIAFRLLYRNIVHISYRPHARFMSCPSSP